MAYAIEGGSRQTSNILPTLFFYNYVPAFRLDRPCLDDLISYNPNLLQANSRTGSIKRVHLFRGDVNLASDFFSPFALLTFSRMSLGGISGRSCAVKIARLVVFIVLLWRVTVF